MELERFEQIVEETFHRLPEKFKDVIDNVGVVVEDYPDDEIVRSMKLRSKRDLLGLYQGIPITRRGTWYGMTPVVPDKISLYRKNIEAHCRTDSEIADAIYDTLIHEIGHYFGMSEDEIRAAGY
jgi:predicted Zn-dependent protease with MMP-like domain